MAVRNLKKILRPKSVAVIGESPGPDCLSRTVLKNLISGGFEGDILAVHSDLREILGLRCYSTVADLPRSTDLAVICTAPETVPGLVRQCGEADVQGIVIISAGFRETGPAGHQREEVIKRQASRYPHLRILGPNCLGLVVPHLKLNASIAAATPKPGRVAFISQSGTLCSSALDWAIQEEIGFSHFISIGNMVEVAVGDLIDYFASDPYTDSIVLYLESITEARGFMSAARAITKDKPIVVYKAGRFAESAEASVSHTGSLSGVDSVYEAAFERAGVVRVFEIDDMFDCAQLLARSVRPKGPRLAIITNAGGPGVVATDSLIDRRGQLARLAPETVEQLNQFLPTYWSHANPVDMLGDAGPKTFSNTIEVVLKDRGVDALLVILTPQTATNPTETARQVAELAKRSSKPILTAWMGGRAVREGIELLRHAGVPTYTTPKNAVHAFMHLVTYARNRETLYETPRDMGASHSPDREEQDELVKSAHATGCEILSEQCSKRLLDNYGIQSTVPQFAYCADEAVRLASKIGYPVVLKIVSPQITHKNEVGGVALNLRNQVEVRDTFDRLVEKVAHVRPDAVINGVSVQPMATAPDGFEMILGSRKDPVFGAVILVGAGGIAAELLQDFALGLPPLNERLARRMLESLRCWPILAGQRQRPPVQIDRLVELLIRFSYLVADCPWIQEMDVNPLLVTGNDVIALDCRVRVDLRHPSNALPYSHLAIRPYPEDLVQPIKLDDNTPLVLRPIRPEDEPLWHRMVEECSPQTIRFRFRSMFRQMTHELATRFCFMDYDRELALVAETVDDSGRRLIGAGHLVCDADHTNAEYAILVPDPWQRHGIGSLITDSCVKFAIKWGLRELVGETDRLNHGMIATFRNAGFELDYDVDPDLVIARLKLVEPVRSA